MIAGTNKKIRMEDLNQVSPLIRNLLRKKKSKKRFENKTRKIGHKNDR